MFKKKKEEIIEKLKLIKESSVHLKELLYNKHIKGNLSSKINKDEQKKHSVISRMRSPPKKEGGSNLKLIKDISNDVLVKLQKKDVKDEALEKEEKKEEINNRIENSKTLALGYISGLLLERENSKADRTSLKLSLSRKKTRMQQFIHTQYLYNCKIQAFLAMVTIFTSIIEYENTVISVDDGKVIHTFHPYSKEAEFYNIDSHYYKRLRIISMFLSYVTFILSFFLWITIYYDDIYLHLLINDCQDKKSIAIITSNRKHFILFILKMILFVLCPNPFTFRLVIHFYSDFYDVGYDIPINSVLTSVCLFRVWFIFKLYLVLSSSYSQRSFRISKINNVKITLMFPFKANMESSALIINIFLFLLALIVCSYNLRIFERYFDTVNDYNLSNYLNDLWCVFITMTTVGYGDISPSSFFGRINIIISCMFGVFLVGLMVVSVTSYLNIEGIDSNIYQILLKSEKMEERNKSAYKAIVQYLKSIREINQEKHKVDNELFLNKVIPNQKKMINHYLKVFKIADGDFLKTIPSLNEYDNIGEHLRFLEENMTKNQDKIVEIVDLIEQLNSAFVKA
jgi:hypothetical protein